MAIETMGFPIKNGDFPQLCKRLPGGTVTDQWNDVPDVAYDPGLTLV